MYGNIFIMYGAGRWLAGCTSRDRLCCSWTLCTRRAGQIPIVGYVAAALSAYSAAGQIGKCPSISPTITNYSKAVIVIIVVTVIIGIANYSLTHQLINQLAVINQKQFFVIEYIIIHFPFKYSIIWFQLSYCFLFSVFCFLSSSHYLFLHFYSWLLSDYYLVNKEISLGI